MKYYKPITLVNNTIMTCDMVRLVFKMTKTSLEKFNKYINELCERDEYFNYKHFTSRAYFGYRELLSFEHKKSKSSFALGLGFNGSNSGQKNNCFIEFNPNKTLSNMYVSPFLDFIKSNCLDIKIARYDIALDMRCPRQLCSLSKDLRNYSKVYKIDIKTNDRSNCTEYLGTRNSHGFVKLYNKTIESGLGYDLTRLELTLDRFDYDEFIKQLPKVSFVRNLDIFTYNSLTDTDRVLLALLNDSNSPMSYLNMLGRVKRDKLKSLMYSVSDVSVCESEYYQLIKNIKQIIA